MPEFKKLDLGDIDIIRPYCMKVSSRICDTSLCVLFMWRDFYDIQFCIVNDTVIIKSMYNGKTSFNLPIGKDVYGALDFIDEYCRDCGIPIVLGLMTGEEANELVLARDDFVSESVLGCEDYLYDAAELSVMQGRKYSGPRNHINKFERENSDYEFKLMTDENVSDAIELYSEICDLKSDRSLTFLEDKKKTFEVLENFGMYRQTGLIMYISGKPKAFAIGEKSGDTMFEHIEKADTRYSGIYQMVVREFARLALESGAKFVNREDDAGEEGLRRSKMSYRPVCLIKKYKVQKKMP